MDWLIKAVQVAKSRQPFVIVTIIEVAGSSPREVGARMVVTHETSFDSVGGGNLEFAAIEEARSMLGDSELGARHDKFVGLGDVLSQCCGGAVRLHFERFDGRSAQQFADFAIPESGRAMHYLLTPITGDLPASSQLFDSKCSRRLPARAIAESVDILNRRFEPASMLVRNRSEEWFVTRIDDRPTRVMLFGAGHIGQALVKALADLPFQIQWVDSRSDMFVSDVPINTAVRLVEDPVALVDEIRSDTVCVVMTHSHALDFDLVCRILQRRQFAWLGLIGSSTKRRRFEQRLTQAGIDAFSLKQLNCPIGLAGVRGKHPSVIAASTAAQLLEVRARFGEVLAPDGELQHG